MPKPILVVEVSIDAKSEALNIIREQLIAQTGNEYHVLVVANLAEKSNEFKVNCYNDCKGILDIDIEKLILSFNENK